MQKEKEEECTEGTKKESKKRAPTYSEKEPNKEEEDRSVIDEWSTEEEIED